MKHENASFVTVENDKNSFFYRFERLNNIYMKILYQIFNNISFFEVFNIFV